MYSSHTLQAVVGYLKGNEHGATTGILGCLVFETIQLPNNLENEILKRPEIQSKHKCKNNLNHFVAKSSVLKMYSLMLNLSIISLRYDWLLRKCSM